MFNKQKKIYEVCPHETKVLEEDAYQIFTGEGTKFIIVCVDCFKLEITDIKTHSFNEEQYDYLGQEYGNVWIDFKGKPGILKKLNPNITSVMQSFVLETIDLSSILAYSIDNSIAIMNIFTLDKNRNIFTFEIKDNKVSESLLLQLPVGEALTLKNKFHCVYLLILSL